MRRTSIVVAALVAFGLTASVALAVSVHFKKGSPQFADQGARVERERVPRRPR